ncbi:MAG: desulfoferrodoxin [archaeon]
MTEKNQIYKCEVCGNIVEVLHEGGGELVCCNQPMKLQKENTVDAATEKHVPVLEEVGEDRFNIKIGEIPHPMTKEHYIEWIEAIGENNEHCKIFLKPGDKPEAEFCFKVKKARTYCNLHGLWENN